MTAVAIDIEDGGAPRSGGRKRLADEELREALRVQEIEQKMGQGGIHAGATDVFAQSLLGAQGREGYVGVDVFVEWDPNNPRARVSPDVFLLEGQPSDLRPSMWCTWEDGCDPPRFALEVVSDRSRDKDYDDNPGKYAALGVEEYVVFDPSAAEAKEGSKVVALQVHRRTARGQFLKVYAGPGPVESTALGAWLVVTDGGLQLRLAHDSKGEALVLTGAERAALAEASEKAERERADAAEARLRQLEEELALLRRGSDRS